jgi:branched-chain amino acid transport system permease protein
MATALPQSTGLSPRLRDAGLAALLALLLGIPFIGFATVNLDTGLGIATRFEWLAVGVVAVFAGRLALGFLSERLETRRRAGRTLLPTLSETTQAKLSQRLLLAAIAFAVLLPVFPFTDRYVLDLGMTVLIYVLLGFGLNVTVGLAGLLDLGFVAFYAIGAYTFAILAKTFGLGFWTCLPLAGLMAATIATVLSLPILRLRGDYLAIVTLGFGEITHRIILNWSSLTGGPAGIGGMPRPTLFGLSFDKVPAEGTVSFHKLVGLDFSVEHRMIFLYLIVLTLVFLVYWAVKTLRRLPVGRAWEALREDEIACRSLGINPTASKVSAYATGAFIGGMAGCLFAARQGFISPESFTFIESALILAIVVLGGMGSQIGVVIAALFIVLLPEFARGFAEYRMLFFGAAMVLIMIWRPGGLLSGRTPTVRLADTRLVDPLASGDRA